MLFIHGGGFAVGSGGVPLYTPEFFLDHDVVFVSGNHRLGSFGFLSVGTAASPGNYGLKDQVLQLQWIQENIAAFNGDPNQVTIFGESAGAASVSYQLISPLSEGLFHKAILQSGTSYAPWAYDFDGISLQLARELGSNLGCDLESDSQHNRFINCLREKKWQDIVEASAKISHPNHLPIVLFVPVAEPENPQAFITKKPSEYVNYHGLHIPIISGYTAQEGIITAAGEIN